MEEMWGLTAAVFADAASVVGQRQVPVARAHELGGCYGLEDDAGEVILDVETYVRRYDAELRSVDHAVDHLLRRLSERGLTDVVVVTSDHGEAFWEHDDYGHSHTLWGETTWVPLVHWGPLADAGQPGDTVGLVGLYGSILGAAGVAAHPTLADTAGGFVQSTDAAGAPWRALVRGEDKWMTDGVRVWHSDVGTDPLDARAERVDAAPALDVVLGRAVPAPVLLQPTEEEAERLRALGYLF